MFKGVKAYLFQDNTVVLNKEDIKNSKDEDFTEVMFYLSSDFIKESAEELEFVGEDEDEDELGDD